MTRKKIDISQKTVTMYGSGKLRTKIQRSGVGEKAMIIKIKI